MVSKGPLASHGTRVRGRRAAILGAGGAARAAAFGLGAAGATVALFNRSPERGRRVAGELGITFYDLERFDAGEFDVIVNATPVGSDGNGLPFDPALLRDGTAVVDMVYLRDRPTPLVTAVRRAGRTAVDGREVLFHQATRQFQLMTGEQMPEETAGELLSLEEPEMSG